MGAALVAFYATAKRDDLLRSCDRHNERRSCSAPPLRISATVTEVLQFTLPDQLDVIAVWLQSIGVVGLLRCLRLCSIVVAGKSGVMRIAALLSVDESK